jgi:hypothetical protein
MSVPLDCPPAYYTLMTMCWEADPHTRPTFDAIVHGLHESLLSHTDSRRISTDSFGYRDFTKGCTEVPRLITQSESMQRRAARQMRLALESSPTRSELPTILDVDTTDTSSELIKEAHEDTYLDVWPTIAEANDIAASSSDAAHNPRQQSLGDSSNSGYRNYEPGLFSSQAHQSDAAQDSEYIESIV